MRGGEGEEIYPTEMIHMPFGDMLASFQAKAVKFFFHFKTPLGYKITV